MFEFSQQRGERDCLICCAAMLTGEDRDCLDLQTCYLDPNKGFPLGNFFALMANYGLFPVPSFPPMGVEPGADGVRRYPGAAVELCGAVGCRVPLEGTPALVTVERFGGGLHALAWTGGDLLDPGRNRAENPVNWNNYQILAVYPFTKKPFGG